MEIYNHTNYEIMVYNLNKNALKILYLAAFCLFSFWMKIIGSFHCLKDKFSIERNKCLKFEKCICRVIVTSTKADVYQGMY